MARALPYLAIALVSGAALALEILLMRLFSIVQWHHFAYMMISLALLGFGASGAYVALRYARHERTPAEPVALHAACFALSGPASFLIAQRLPFNPLEVIWSPGQWLALGLTWLLLLVPFFFASNCVCLALASRRWPAAGLYGADLAGAAIGALGVLAAMAWCSPVAILIGVATLGLLAALVAGLAVRPAGGGTLAAGAAALAAVVVLAAVPQLRALHPNDYKMLPQQLRVAGAELIERRYSPLGRVSVVRSPEVPLRHVPGLSLANRIEPPPQLGVFTDADSLTAITRYRPGATDLGYLANVPSAAAYTLLEAPRVLILGAGAGAPVLQAIHHGARAVEAVEINPRIVELVRGTYAAFAGGLYDREDVTVRVAEARSHVSRRRGRVDLLAIPMLESYGASGAGLQAIQEDYAYTVEAVGAYLERLAPGGVLALSQWVRVPPRAGVKLFATVVAALERTGESDPGRALVWLRGVQTQTILVRPDGFSAAELERLREFCDTRWFDLAHAPGLDREAVNRHNVLPQPYFHEAARAILGPDRERFFERYKFQIRPSTDRRPYFFHFFRWSLLPELLAMPAHQGWSFVDLAYPILIATLVQAVIAGVALILLPLVLGRRRLGGLGGLRGVAGPGAYFLAIGLGFMFVEIAAIQRFTLYVGHPVFAAAAGLAGFLLFAGLGSLTLGRWTAGRRRPLAAALVALVGLAVLAQTAALPALFDATLAAALPVRLALTLAAIAPVALLMGVALPTAMARLPPARRGLLAWCWGVNGCGSVIGAVAAAVIALHAGTGALVASAAALYLVAGLVLLRSRVFGPRG